MPTLEIDAPGLDSPLTVTFPQKHAVAVGRNPDTRAARGHVPENMPLMTCQVTSSYVSATHLLAWADPGHENALCVCDPGSTNGSSVVLAPGVVVKATGRTEETIRVFLAAPGRKMVDIGAAVWSAEADASRAFACGVAARVQEWFRKVGLNARAEAVLPDHPHDPDPRSFALPEGWELRVTVDATSTVPWNLEEWMEVVSSYVAEQNRRFWREAGHDADFVCASESFKYAHDKVVEAAQHNQRLVLLGESGSGKERLAHCYHIHGPNAAGPFVVAMVAGQTGAQDAEMELFGVAPHAYTDVGERPGCVESANGGTLFIDEIGDVPSEVQTKLLRALDTGEFRRKGASPERGGKGFRHSTFNLVCATNKDLPGMVKAGTFRHDLWGRIAQTVVHVPPLRERPEDVQAYLQQRQVGEVCLWNALADEAKGAVRGWRWEYGFRELQYFADRLAVLIGKSPGKEVSAESCREMLHQLMGRDPARRAAPPASGSPGLGLQSLADLARNAAKTFEQQYGQQSSQTLDWPALNLWMEDYLKPLIVATAVELAKRSPSEGDPTQEELRSARAKLRISDASTVKKYLKKYRERFNRNS